MHPLMNPDVILPTPAGGSRRKFLKQMALATAAVACARYLKLAAAPGASASAELPWYSRTMRWMLINISELDPTRYDIPWWREQWKRTQTQGIVANAGGIVAFYPTQVPLQRRAQFLGDRDIFGAVCKAAHDDGIAVFARMDSDGADDSVYKAHPEWFAINATGRPYRARNLYVPCVNGGYYREHIAAIVSEIAGNYHPEGFTDNSWSGLPRNSICYCDNCVKKFRADRSLDLPRERDWNAPAYRAWIEWSYASRLENWDLFNQAAHAAGGPNCVWIGQTGGNISGSAAEFRDYREICRRAEILMLDNQHRNDSTGFQANGVSGRVVNGMLGWDKLAPESVAMYQAETSAGASDFRLASKPEPEVRLWALDGIAAGMQAKWHYINAYQEDRRMYDTPVALGAWLSKNEEFLVRRHPIATVGILYSQRNNDFFGREDAEAQVNAPQRGFTEALLRARIPYQMVHAEDLDRDAANLRLLVLPNVGTMTDAQVESVRNFVQKGGGLIASGAASLCDQWGDARADLALADLFGVHLPPNHSARTETGRRRSDSENSQSYLRLTPELRAKVYGPHIAGEPPAAGVRHPALQGFEKTDILPFGGTLEPLTVDASAQVLLTFVPSRPTAPPESIWLQNDHTDLPGLIVNERAGFGRVAYLAADLDRRYARNNMADFGRLLGNLLRWAARDDIPLSVEGEGLIDSHLYRQPGRAIVHLVNLTNANTWRGPVEELIPVGPLKIGVRLPADIRGRSLRLLVSGQKPALVTADGWTRFELSSILDQEVAVIEG
jgi:hypothetical protein